MLLSGAVSPVAAAEWGTNEHEIVVDTLERSYLAFAPESLPEEPMPVMLVMHGGLGNAKGVEKLYGMNEVAEREGFIAVYPNGPRIGRILLRKRRTWNAGECCGPAVDDGIDDVAFVAAMIEDLADRYPVDRRRVYASGMSNGAMMAYRLVCDLPDSIAAAIPVAGTLTLDQCADGSDVPVFHIHGAADRNVPMEGGIGSRSLVEIDYRSLDETLDLLTRQRKCNEPVFRTENDGSEVRFYDCADGAPIQVRILPDTGHIWPGADARLFQRDRYHGTFSASEAAWAFARQFSNSEEPE